MNKFLLGLLLIAPLATYGQFDYELYQQYAQKETRLLNKEVKSTTMSQKFGDKWNKVHCVEFNGSGLPHAIYEYSPDPEETKKKEFRYKGEGEIVTIETYTGTKHSGTTEF